MFGESRDPVDVPEKYAFPFDQMEVGDSFEVPYKLRGRVTHAVRRYGPDIPSFRLCSLREGKAVRFWRVR